MQTAAKQQQAEDFYSEVCIAAGMIPDDSPSDIAPQLENLVQSAADLLSHAIDPATLTEIREYALVRDDDVLFQSLLDRLIEKAHDDEADPNLDWFRYPEQIGFEKVLKAPVETPAEFVAWLRAAHCRMFDGLPCASCGKPVPYADRYVISDWRGERSFHSACGEVA